MKKKTSSSKKSRKIAYIVKYIFTIVSWSFLVLLFLVIGLLGYYFYALKVYEEKGYEYAPIYSIYTIVSPSMVPTINVYDMIINFKVDNPLELNKDDIITFKSTALISEGLTITHRINDVQLVNGEYQYITKGDNNSAIDPSPALYKNIIGKTAFRLPGFGKIQKFISSSGGLLLIIIIPALLLIISDIYKIIKFKNIKGKSTIANSKMVKKTTHLDKLR